MQIELVFERPTTIPLKENSAEAAIASAIALSKQPYGVTYDPKHTTRFEYDGVTIRVDSESKLWPIWWEFYLIKNNRIVRENGVTPHPRQLSKEEFINAISCCIPLNYDTVEDAVADYEEAYRVGN